MTRKEWMKKELKEVFAISFTFFVLFLIFTLLKKVILAQHQIQIYVFGTALIGSLIIGKVVVIFDKLPLTKKYDHLPKIYGVFFRSIIYLTGYIIFTFFEHSIKGLIEGDSFLLAFNYAFKHLGSWEFITGSLILFIAFLVFNTFWMIRNHFGPGKLFALFFRKIDN